MVYIGLKSSYHIIFILPSTETVQDKISTAETERQRKLLLHPSQKQTNIQIQN